MGEPVVSADPGSACRVDLNCADMIVNETVDRCHFFLDLVIVRIVYDKAVACAYEYPAVAHLAESVA